MKRERDDAKSGMVGGATETLVWGILFFSARGQRLEFSGRPRAGGDSRTDLVL